MKTGNELDKRIEALRISDDADFARALEGARSFYRRHRKLVEAKVFSKRFAHALQVESGEVPGDIGFPGEEIFEDNYEAELRERARRIFPDAAEGCSELSDG